jgi:lactate dehydrogenase-like 2-hydroxyacid dehydrogenase
VNQLINEETLKLMKPTAYSINSSRGPVVDKKALAQALKDKVIAGVALDLFQKGAVASRFAGEIANRCRVFHHFASSAQITRPSLDPDKGMPEGNYGGDPAKMPYVVNKEAFA